ncbi:helix-turn-helix transcriptional regulator [Treponema sp.]|uniref:helix-turn-helix transcriptional regulator n=1 Tax=Treponema sp. TaxID=166 RepID=UPI00298DB539|nr:helix-turn-helix transcriptional regulator [Treponema sp.]
MIKALKFFREQNNYSQSSVASFLGISRQMYIKYESGEVEPPLKTVVDLSKLYRIPYDIIIDDKIPENQNLQEHETFEIADPSPSYGPSSSQSSSYYLNTILQMLPKLIYAEQLKVLAALSSIVQKETEDKIEPNKRKEAFQKVLALNEELHLKSDGERFTREDLYKK